MKTERLLISLAVLAALCLPAAAVSPIPAHPRDLKYGTLNFEVPKPEKYQFKLKNGIPVYIAEDHSLPLVDITFWIRTGTFLEPKDKVGLAGMTGTMMRRGGAGTWTAEQFDERADFLAANLVSFAGTTESQVGLNALTQQLDPSLDLLFAMLTQPRFQQDRLDIEKGNALEAMKQRNDNADNILRREWNWQLYGENHYSVRQGTQASLEAVTRQDLVDFHKKYWRPEGMVISVSGDITPKDALARLEARFAAWKLEGPKPAVPWPPSQPTHTPKPGLYYVEKDIPQAKVSIGHLAAQWDPKYENPDIFALMVMNDILGGGGFTSRITKRVRSDEGLAYSAGSQFGVGTYWPGPFRIFFQTKSASVAFASSIALAEVKKIQNELVTADELTTSKNSFIETFPRQFESAGAIADTFAADQFLGRPHAYWQKYRDNLGKVTAGDVQRVAREYLNPAKMIFLLVGKWEDIQKGDPDRPAKIVDFGTPVQIPLRDPLTLQPIQ